MSLSFLTEYLKPIAAHEREEETLRAKEKAELEAIRKAEAAKSEWYSTIRVVVGEGQVKLFKKNTNISSCNNSS